MNKRLGLMLAFSIQSLETTYSTISWEISRNLVLKIVKIPVNFSRITFLQKLDPWEISYYAACICTMESRVH